MPTASGTFDLIDMGEDPLRQADGEPRLAHAHGKQRFNGGIEGDGSVDWLACYLPDRTARLIGLQHIDGRIGDRRGTFVVEAFSSHDGKSSKGSWSILPGTGTAGLEGIRGSGTFEAAGGKTVEYRLDYELEG
jgi:hypothetical protein